MSIRRMPGINILSGVKTAVAVPGFHAFWGEAPYKVTHEQEHQSRQQAGVTVRTIDKGGHERGFKLYKRYEKKTVPALLPERFLKFEGLKSKCVRYSLHLQTFKHLNLQTFINYFSF
jgi:hypothetical protein